jgi:hypothetical protein
MNKKCAFKIFKQEILKQLTYNTLTGNLDKPALRQAWNDFTDMLCKSGQITQNQYDTWLGPIK